MKERRFFIFILFLFAIILSTTLLNANGLKVYMEVAPGTANSQILGDTYPRNVSLELLQTSFLRVEWHNLLTADTFYRVLFTKQSMDLDLTNCRGFDNTNTYFKLLPISAYYTDSTPIADPSYEIGPNSSRSDTIKFQSYTTLGYNSYLLYADTAKLHSSFPSGENYYDFVFHAIKKGDIGFDIRKDFGSGAVLTGATIRVDSGINSSTLTGGGPYIDGTTDSDATANGLIYFVEGTHFNANSCTEYGFIVSHPDYPYSAICDSTSYKNSSTGPNMIYVLMRDLNFKITGVEANSGDRTDTQYGEADINYDVDKEDTVISFYVYASESSDSSHNYTQPVTDLPTDVSKWFISISNNGIVYSETNPVAISNIGGGTYVVTVYNDSSVAGNWGALVETGVVSCTISVKYFQTPLPGQPDTYYFYLSDTAANMVQVFDIEINNDSWTQPDSGTMIITIDKLGDTITGGRYEALSSGDTVVLSLKITIDTAETNIDNSSNVDSIIIQIGSLAEGTEFHLSSETYVINNGVDRIGRAIWFDSSVTPGLYDIYDTVVWKYQGGAGYNPQIIVANDSNLSGTKPQIRVINLNATLEVSPINVDDDDSTYFTFRITNIGDTDIGETITIQLLTPFTGGFDMAETVTESGGGDTWIVTYNGTDSTITVYEPYGLTDSGIVPGEYIQFTIHANSIDKTDSSIAYQITYFTAETYPYVPARDGSGKLELDTYILDVTSCTLPLEVHNFNCTFAISSVSKVIDDGDTYRITITIYNQGSSPDENMDSAVLTFTDNGTTYYLSNLQCTTSVGGSWAGGSISANGDSIIVGSLTAGDTGLITFDIWTPNLVEGDSVWTMMMTAYDSCGGTYNSINDTSVDTITIKDLAAYYSIATYDAQSNIQGIYLNDNAANTIKITLYNETGATTADTIGSFIIYFDAAFRNSVDTITGVTVEVGKTGDIVYLDSYPTIGTGIDPQDSIVFTASTYDSIVSGDSIIISLTVITNDLTSDTTSSISITVYSKTEPAVYDETPLNSLNTTNDSIVIKAFEVRIKSCSAALSVGSQFGDGETITVVINFDTASASGGTNSNTIDSYSIIFEEPDQNIVDWITDYNGMADYDSITSGSNDTITYKAAKPSANIGDGYCTFVISLNDLSANSYMNVKVIGYKYAYDVSGNTAGFLIEYSDSIRITIQDNDWFNLRVKSAATSGETVEIGTTTSLKSFDLIITNPSLTTTVDTIIFDTAYAVVGDSFTLSHIDVIGASGVDSSYNSTTAGETIVIYKDNLINTNSTIIVRFYYTTGSLTTVDYQVWNVSFYDTNLATYILGYDTIGLQISSLSLSSYADDRDTVNYNSPGNMIISLVLQNYGGPTGYTNPDSHWAIYIGGSGDSYPLTINNIWQGYYDVANNKCNYSFDVTLNTANLSPNTYYSIKVIFSGNSNDTLSEIYGENTIRFINDLTIIDSSVSYLTSGATAVDSGSFVQITFNFNDATLISDSNVSTNLSSGTYTVQITGNQVDFIIPCMTDALGTGETVAFNFISTSGNTTTVTLNLAVDTQAPLYAPTVNMVNDTIILTDTFEVNVDAYDSVGISKVELSINGSGTMTDTSVPYSFIINVPAISITGSTITITAYDNAMHSISTQIVNVNIDTVAPTLIAFANITSGDSFGGTNVTFSISAADAVAIDSVEVYYRYNSGDTLITTIDGAKASTKNCSVTWNISSLTSDTGYELWAKVIDQAGNYLTSSGTVHSIKIDNNAPLITEVNLPDTGEIIVKGYEFNINVSDSSTVNTANLIISKNASIVDRTIPLNSRVDTNTAIEFASVDTYIVNWDLETGDWWYRIVISDVFGNTYTSNWIYFRYYENVPVIKNVSVTYPSGQSRAKIGDEITITALIEGPAGRTIYAGIKADNIGDTAGVNILAINDTVSVLMNDNGTNGDNVAGDSLFTGKITIGIDTGVISDTITIVAGLDTSNIATAVCVVNLDTTAPVISSVRVADANGDRVFNTGIELKGTIAQIRAEASDNVGISKVEFSYKLNSADTYILIGEDSADSYIVGADLSAMLTAYGTGPYTLRVRAYDEAGNSSETELVYTIWSDITAPVISSVKITVPSLNITEIDAINNLTVKGITILKITAQDNESSINRVAVNLIEGSYTINKTTLFDTITGAYITYLNIDDLAGLDTFILQIKAYDEANNETSIQYELNIWQDTIVPQITISGNGLENDTFIREMIYTLTASCTDNYNFAKVVFEISENGLNNWVKFNEITIDTMTGENVEQQVLSCTIPFDVTNLDKSKKWDVRATVYDVYYNSATSSITGLRFDTSVPVISIIETAAINTTTYIELSVGGATLPAAVTIFKANVSDSFNNVAAVTFYLKAGAGNYVPISTIYEAPYQVYINVANWTNNLAYTLKVVAEDDCGNTGSLEISNLYKYVDTVKPQITDVYVRDGKGSRSIISGEVDTELRGTLAYITAVVSDNIEVSNVEFSYKGSQTNYILIDEKSISSAAGSCSVSLNIAALLDNSGTGPYTLRVRAKDTSNNDTEIEIAFTIYKDITPPSFISNIASGSVLSGNVIISAITTATDVEYAIFEYKLSGSDTVQFGFDVDTPYVVALNTKSLLADSDYLQNVMIRIRLVDTTGNDSSLIISGLTINNIETPVVTLVRPDSGAVLRGSIRFECAIVNGERARFNYRLVNISSGAVWTSAEFSSLNSVIQVNPGVADGLYRLEVVATLSNGDTVLSNFYVIRIDNTAPAITINDFYPNVEAADSKIYYDKVSIKGYIVDSSVVSVNVTTENIEINKVYGTADTRIIVIANLIEGENNITIKAKDEAGNETTKNISIVYVKPTAVKLVAASGDTITAPDSTQIVIPAGALEVGKEITVKPVAEEQIFVPESSSETAPIISTGIAREFLPHGTIFNKTVTVKIPYTDLDLDTNADGVPDLNENDLRAYYWDGIRWVEQNSMVDTVNKVVIWYTNHFSIVGIFAGSSMAITNTKTVYMTRNPLKPGNPYTSQENEGTIFKIDYNAFDVELFTVNIYDLNGRLKVTLSNNSNEVPWTGLNNGGEFIGSGLYVYKARVQLKNGEIIEKFGKLGIIK